MANDQIVQLRDGVISFSRRPAGWRWPRVYRSTTSDENGQFTLPTEIQTAAVVVAHPLGVRVLSFSEFAESPEITLQPWGLLEGQVIWGDAPGSGETVTLSTTGARPTKDFQPMFMVSAYQKTVADENGRFVFGTHNDTPSWVVSA